MRLRLAFPGTLVDLNKIGGLSYIREQDGFLRIGAMTREAELEHSALVQGRYPLLADAGRVIADPLVRNRGTVGGNLAHADPANDHPATMLALGASVVATGPEGERGARSRSTTSSSGCSRARSSRARSSPRSAFPCPRPARAAPT